MRRADRLFQIVTHLRGRRLTTAAQLAEWLRVSTRTVYRDIRDLSLSGVPIEGEAGVGYRVAKGFDLPPLMFTFDEVEALVAGARMMEAWGGPALQQASRSALAKIALALPPDRKADMERSRIFAPSFHLDPKLGPLLETVRQAIGRRMRLQFRYEDKENRPSNRVIRPLGLYFWGSTWTLAAWCETRRDFRNFRLDRMHGSIESGKPFEDEAGKTLEDFMRKIQEGRV
jgi:predicted DNA-binding transcriptional regulator YafY